MVLRHLAFVVPPLLLAALNGVLAWGPLAANGFSVGDALLLALFVLTAAYVAAQSWPAALGFFDLMAERRQGRRPLPAAPFEPRRLAVVMPIYDEDVPAVFGALATLRHSMAAAGLEEACVFALSDSRDLRVAADEEAAFAASAKGTAQQPLPPFFYRRRRLNLRRKAGNIAEFLEERGDEFDFMVVLDADSLMTGSAIRRLAGIMAAEPKLGLLQTVCYPARRDTLFSRFHQFAAHLNAPLHTRGLTFWTGPDGVYWGHNAIIRVAPFREHCELPVLPGQPPLGGEILCHDIVEAALLRRAGWEVRVLPDLAGTWEDLPSNTLDFAVRDRRWCQGNLQHMRLLRGSGFSWPFRYHFVNGILAYASAPVWLGFMILATLIFLIGSEQDARDTLLVPALTVPALFWLGLAVFFIPRFLSLGVILADPRARAAFGGAGRLTAGAFAEILFGLLWAPMTLLFYTVFVFRTLSGRTVSWDPQNRGDRGVGWREAARRHAWHTAIGVGWGAAMLWANPVVFWWMSPFFLGLTLSIPVTVFSSRSGWGLAARRAGLFLTPDETLPEPELRALPREVAAVAKALSRNPALPSLVVPLETPENAVAAVRPAQ